MTIVAGASLFNGVLLTADVRGTYTLQDGKVISVDNLNKLVSLTPHVGLGVAGNVPVAGDLIQSAIRQLRHWNGTFRIHPRTVLRWLPRYLSWRYNDIRRSYSNPEVHIILAAVVPGRPNVVEKARVLNLFNRITQKETRYSRNWFPGILFNIISTPAYVNLEALSDSSEGYLCHLNSPTFKPRYYPPLSAIAIGSGSGAIEQIDKEADWVFAGDVGNNEMEAGALEDAVRHYLSESPVSSVGGLMNSMMVTAKGCKRFTSWSEIPAGGTRIELRPDAKGRLEQRNLLTGKVIPLRYPWELSPDVPMTDMKFDDLDEALDIFRGKG